jgi:3-oxoacyl-[acyl-carrier protein] reductase
LLSRSEDSLRKTRNELPAAAGQQHDFLVADFFNPATLKETLEHFTASTSIQILVNNTGGPPAGPALTADLQDYLKAFSAHLICSQILVQALVPGMKNAHFGRIINIVSTSVKIPIRGLGVSNTIRGAVANWSKTLSSELGPFGITVNNVLPGATMTSRLTAILHDKSEKSGKTFEEIKNEMISEIPAGRICDPSEVAAAVAFLASPAAGYINGINLPVDGGRTGSL